MYQITRKKLVKIAFKAIKAYQGQISKLNRSHLLYAACTVDEIALNEWVIDKDCGCLVGSAYIAVVKPSKFDAGWEPDQDYVLAADQHEALALMSLGVTFDDLLRDIVDPKGKNNERRVQVID